MANKFLFGLCLLMALCLHALAFIVFPDKQKTIIAGGQNSGQGKGSLSIGFAGSAGNGIPLATVKTSETQLIAAQKSHELTQTITPAPILETAVSATVHKTVHINQIIRSQVASALTQTKLTTKVIKSTTIKPLKAQPILAKIISPLNTKKSIQSSKVVATKDVKQVIKNNDTGNGTRVGHLSSNIVGKGNSASGDKSIGGQNKGQLKSYHGVILAWLEKHKRYPRMAKRRHQQGTATIYFKIDRDGQLLQHNIRNSSGYSSLDREVIAMLNRANPLPPAPKQLAGQTLEFTLPVAFNIKSH